jgi:hypothetical protein
MPDSKRFRKYFEHDASATRWALNSTASALTAKSVSRSSRQWPEGGERGVVRHAAAQREPGRSGGGGLRRGGRGAGGGGGGGGGAGMGCEKRDDSDIDRYFIF